MPNLRDLPIRQKLLGITMVTLLAALVPAGLGIVLVDSYLFRNAMRNDIITLASIIADNSTAALAFDDRRVASETLSALQERPHMVAACIYAPDGSIFASFTATKAGPGCPPPSREQTAEFSSRGLTVSHPIMLDNSRLGTLVLLLDTGESVERVKLYLGIVLAILLASSLLAFLLSSKLREILVTQVSRLAGAAASVSKTGDYSVRVAKYSNDELGVLVDGFNQMLERVQARDLEVERARSSLHTTLTSIGDAVISTDAGGRVVFTNPVAQALIGWSGHEAAGRHIDEVFRIVNENSRQPLEAPIHMVLRHGGIAAPANHTILIARDGTEVPIDDSAAPIRDARGHTVGVVLVFRDISGRRATERILANQTAELSRRAQLMKHVPCFEMDLEERIIFWNPGAEELYGFTEKEALGQNSHDLLRTEFPVPLEEIRKHLMQEGHWDGELQHVRRGGVMVTVASQWTLHRDVEGKVVSILQVNVDITARKYAEEALRESEELVRVTLSSIGDAVLRTDWLGRVLYLNPMAEQLTGWTTRDAEGRPLEEVFHIIDEDTRRRIESPAMRVLREGKMVGLANHTLLISRAGREIAIDDSAAPIRNARGEMLGVVLVFRDVTGKRAVERELAAREERLRMALTGGRTVGFDWDLGTGVVAYSNNAEEVLGLAPGLGRWTLWENLHPEDTVQTRGTIEEAIRECDEWRMEARFLRPDRGDLLWIDIRGKVGCDALGRASRASGIITDVTERKQMDAQRAELLAKERALASERALRETEAELARVVRALSVGELATSIAHEINQPLAGVVTNAEAGLRWLNAREPDLEEVRESLVLIARDGNRAGAVIRRIRAFLKKESPQAVSIDINDVVQETAAFAGFELEKRGVELRLQYAADLPCVMGDRVQLQQVILNLMMNGADAMDSTSGPKELSIMSRLSESGDVIISVRDSGIGMSPEELHRMFDAFFTTKKTGMGMGLSISRTIIESHGGKIWATRNDGPGLTVQFSLPAESSADFGSDDL
jgi:PAS domain S-box-containing protein